MVVYRNKFTRSVVGWGEVTGKKQFQWRMLKGPSLESSVVHISVTKCHFRSYHDNIGPKFKKPEFLFLGA